MTGLLRTREELFSFRSGVSGPLVLVPTMGALHEGHRTLLRAGVRAAASDGTVLVSVFVNPLQFGPGEDLDRYPRTLDDDLKMCAEEGVAAVFAPSAAEMYPGGAPVVTVDPGPPGAVLEGAFRPGFFGGVLTVVLKLFSLVRPAVAVFGEKDAQQLAMVRRMVSDLDLGVAIEPVPTVRDEDGLAMSSRNRYLSAAEREDALALPRALRAGALAAWAGPGAVLAAARQVLSDASGVTVDYLSLADPATFAPYPGRGPAVLAVAARVGATRLIDNVRIEFWPSDRLTGGPGAADH
jgi:pantoate--beta-alanine ligase